MFTKTITPRDVILKEEGDVGTAEVVFATLGVVDKDGDIAFAADFQDGASAKVAPWGHDWGSLPTGGATIHVSSNTGLNGEDEMIAKTRFLLKTDQGRNTYETLKGLKDMGVNVEWSYGFDTEREPFDMNGKLVQRMRSVKVHEVSPVMIGAGVNTRTLAVKGVDTGEVTSGEIMTGPVGKTAEPCEDCKQSKETCTCADDASKAASLALVLDYEATRALMLGVSID
jgi:hypothetical protein